MSWIQTVHPSELEGLAGELTSSFLKTIGYLPAPLAMLSASPELLEAHCHTINRYRTHQRLSVELLNCIRYLVSVDQGFEPCVEFNSDWLRWMGMTDEQLNAMRAEPRAAPIEPREQELLAFVMLALSDPDAVEQAELVKLRKQDWTDADILEACFHGADLIGKARLVRALRVETLRALD